MSRSKVVLVRGVILVFGLVVATTSFNFAADGDLGGPQQSALEPPNSKTNYKKKRCQNSNLLCTAYADNTCTNLPNNTCTDGVIVTTCEYVIATWNVQWGLCSQDEETAECNYYDKTWCCRIQAYERIENGDCFDLKCNLWYYRVNACYP